MIDKKFGHCRAEQTRHAKRQQQRGIIFVSFDRVDRLARYAEPPGKFALAPAVHLAEMFQTIFYAQPD